MLVFRSLLIALLLFVGLPSSGAAAPETSPPPAAVPSDRLFGIAEAHQRSEMAWQAGARWQRVLFYWDAIQPEWNGQAQQNRHVDDVVIQRELARGFELVGVIGNPPRWATGDGSVPRNLDLPIDHPDNNWARFTRELAARYAGRIDNWIIWNEPDIPPGDAGSTWNGTPADYWLLLKTASKAIRSTNPRATVAFAGTTYWADALRGQSLFLERVLEVAARDPEAHDNGFFFDVVPFHLYGSPYKVYEVARLYREVLRRYGLERPLWLAETNVVPYDDPHADVPRGPGRATLQEQASFVVQMLAMARAARLERVQLYKMTDGPIEGGEPYGLVRNDGTPRPAYTALKTAVGHLLAPGHVTYQQADGVARVVIDGGPRRTTVVWATGPHSLPAKLPPVGTRAVAIEKLGLDRSLAFPTTDAHYDLTLARATASSALNSSDFVIGGDPVIVVEQGVGEAVDLAPDAIFFPITGFAVTGPRLDYFRRRGELATFGYPISRPFRLIGREVQLFQRQAIERRADGSIGTLNLLDEFLPYTRFNGAVIPARDEALARSAPASGTSGYDVAVMRWLAGAAPDEWGGIPVRFGATFHNTVTLATAFPGGSGDRSLLPGLNLELWGLPTSPPALDPANHDFIYQRFQRGVMHHDRKTGQTQGLLLAAYLKAIMTGQDLPTDLADQARASRFHLQYAPGQPGSVARPAQLPDTDLTDAFERQPPRG